MFQKETASQKSRSKEATGITTPDESGEEMGSPSEPKESRRSAASKRSAAPESEPDTTEGTSAAPYDQPKSGQPIRIIKTTEHVRPKSRNSIEVEKTVASSPQADQSGERGRTLEIKPTRDDTRL